MIEVPKVLDNVERLLIAVVSGRINRCDSESSTMKLTVYRMGNNMIRIYIKDKEV